MFHTLSPKRGSVDLANVGESITASSTSIDVALTFGIGIGKVGASFDVESDVDLDAEVDGVDPNENGRTVDATFIVVAKEEDGPTKFDTRPAKGDTVI